MNQMQTELLREFEQLNWGTMMPITTMLGGEIVSLRARGTCSVTLNNAVIFENQVTDADELRYRVKNLIPLKLADILGEVSSNYANINDLAASKGELALTLKSKMDEDLAPLGLMIKQINMDAIESAGF